MEQIIFANAYGRYAVKLHERWYDNGRIAIAATDEDGLPAFTATVNLPNEKVGPDEAFVKDYAENEGMLEFLQSAGIVTGIVRHVKAGFVTVPLCKIDRKRLAQLTR